ncbi:glutathione S-transferase family protein [Pseudacidovorax sp. RU35E]|uniref:glutathione S-transferase family protein n=1 Tax=Pseudacidovorax sp. RU35E TaxID=1907403 RepID=UPI000954102C|nr:glutathione S-transferase [Pseudacidovorax sp. RU35E]SIQ74024.1 glutathione S-transferase [Pseudacidovorax sp. RU35E]
MPDHTPHAVPALVLHDAPLSGHAHRVRLFLSLLGLPWRSQVVDLRAGEQRRPAFLALNRFGQVPMLQDGDVVLADSNAILVYLNARYAPQPARWLPTDPIGAAQVQRWLSLAAGPLASGPAAARIDMLMGRPRDEATIARAHALLQTMDAHLATQDFLAATHPTLADIAHYAYVAHAPEGHVALDGYPHLQAWLARIEALPGFLPMPRSAIGLRA